MARNDKDKTKGGSDYTPDSIEHLKAIEGIRKNPGMYIGGTDAAAMHHLVNEIVDNSVDEFGGGFGDKITITVHEDESISIADDGRGIPVGMSKAGVPTLQLVFTEIHAGGKFSKDGSGAYHKSGGLHGIGATAVNAMSTWLEATVERDGKSHAIRFEKGIVTEPVHETGKSDRTGTTVRFKPDVEMFGEKDDNGKVVVDDVYFSFKRLAGRMRELAFLNAGLTIELVDERGDEEGEEKREIFHSESGLEGYIALLVGDADLDSDYDDEDGDDEDGEPGDGDDAEKKKPKKKKKKNVESRTPVIQFTGEMDDVTIDVAMQWTDADKERIESYCNNIHTNDGGKHVEGLRMAISHSFEKAAKIKAERESQARGTIKKKSKKSGPDPRGDDYRYGLTAVISVKVADPQFENQTKNKLKNTDVSGKVQRFVNEHLGAYLEEYPDVTDTVRAVAEQAARIREAMKKAKDLVKKGQSSDGGKLTPCRSKNPDEIELFLVEGDSAGGTAKNARDANNQAILPLRGKILNVEKAKIEKMLGHREIAELIRHIGTGITAGVGDDFDLSKLKYGKIIIMTDADVDGAHIRTLLLTFFFRQMRPLIEAGNLYVAQPPLFRFVFGSTGKGKNKKDKGEYIYKPEDHDQILRKLGLDIVGVAPRPKDADGETPTDALKRDKLDPLPKRDLAELVKQIEVLERVENDSLRKRHNITLHEFLDAGRENKKKEWEAPALYVEKDGHRITFMDDAELTEWMDENYPLPDKPEEPEAADGENGDSNGNDKERAAYELALAAYNDALRKRPLVAKFSKKTREQVAGALEKIDGWGQKYNFTRDDLIATDKKSRKGQQAPFAIDTGKEIWPAWSLIDIVRLIRRVGKQSLKAVERFKGLGEMNDDELRETAMEKHERKLQRVSMEDALEAEKLFSTLMGTNVAERYEYISENAPTARIDV